MAFHRVCDYSFAESILTCTSMESLGQKIQQAAHTGITKQLSTIAERTEINNSHVRFCVFHKRIDSISSFDVIT